ncbi:MAG: ABC transporter substrate-binding protein [Endomicrobiia bacterium]
MKFVIWSLILFVWFFQASAQQNYPQRIISLGPAITKALYLLGVEDRLIANTIYCNIPPEAKKKEKIGTVMEINIEKIFALKPDLVLATTLINPKSKQKLKSLGINVITFPTPKNFNEICTQFLQLGKLVGKEKEARKIVESAKDKASSIKKKVKDPNRPKVLIQVGTKPLWVAPRNSFLNDFIEFAGGINIGPSGKSGLCSREEILRRNPDVIIITTMGIVAEEEKKIWQKYKSINAVKNNRIYIIDSEKLCSPTPVSFVETLQEIVYILYSRHERALEHQDTSKVEIIL